MSHPDGDRAPVSKPRVANPFEEGRKEQKKWRENEERNKDGSKRK
jgi:hypothetical protein